MKILVVDDSAMIRSMIRHELEEGGYSVTEASDGVSALNKACVDDPPDLITLDIEMPEPDGFETCRRLREEHYARRLPSGEDGMIPVIFVTGYDTLEDRRKGFQLGAMDFLTKPFSRGQILEAVNGVLKPEAGMEGLTALVADCDPVALRIMAGCLQNAGVKVIETRDGTQAFSAMCNSMSEIDLVITGISLPSLKGDVLCRKIRKELNLRDVPVIILVNEGEQPYLLNIFKSGATDYLIKPCCKEELLSRLTVHLERAQFNKRLRRTVVELQALNQMRDNLLAVCSHDLRTPLNGILGFTELLLQKDYLGSDDRDNLEQVKVSGEYLLSLINDILDLGKIQSRHADLEMEPVSLRELAKISVNLLTSLAASKQQLLIFDCSSKRTTVSGNRRGIIRMINNLLSNAIKFTPSNGMIHVSVEPGADSEVMVSVADNGIGIPALSLPRLFDRYSRTSRNGTMGESGTGLGLSIIRELMEKHGGRVDVASEEGKGACFKLHFPLMDEEVAVQPQDELPVITAGSQAGTGEKRRHVLLAEDNPVNVKLIRKMISRIGYSVTVAENGRAAFEEARKGVFDAILMDVRMPVMDGVEAAGLIREMVSSDVPVIAMTASVDNKSVEECLSAGMNDFIAKPFKAADLENILKKWCRDRSTGIRESERVDCYIRTVFEPQGGPRLICESINISATGLFLKTDSSLPVGTRGNVILSFPGGMDEITVTGECEVVRAASGGADEVKGLGLKFTKLDNDSFILLHNIITSQPVA